VEKSNRELAKPWKPALVGSLYSIAALKLVSASFLPCSDANCHAQIFGSIFITLEKILMEMVVVQEVVKLVLEYLR